MGGRGSGSRVTNGRSYDSYDKTVVDTLIVERNGRYTIEPYTDQDLDVYDHAAELNHDKLLENKYRENHGAYYMKDITLDNIFDYLKRQYNFRG